MRPIIEDMLIGMALAALVVVVLLFSSFQSTFIYRGF
jgi:hypothetical protein